MNKNYHYNKQLKNYSRGLRTDSTKAEVLLWTYVLKAKKTGFQFNRQYAIENYIVDFICRKLKLIIEIDGSSHFYRDEEDFIKQKKLKELGFQILRFSEAEVIHRMDIVIEKIEFAILSISSNENYK